MPLSIVGSQACLPRSYPGVIAESPAMKGVLALVERVAPATIPILILGETGVGKEVVAQLVHDLSGRSGAFIAVNCAELRPDLAASELFGAVRGAFTGAERDRGGLFQEALNGTLLLDEIGELDLSVQAALLRALSTGAVRRVGASRVEAASIRLVAATNRDLEREVAAGRFRADLYHRLAGCPIWVPPLRARREDIAPLVSLAMRRAGNGAATPAIANSTWEWLACQSWPGNVRELNQAVERALLFGGNAIEPAHFVVPAASMYRPPREGAASLGDTARERWDDLERTALASAIERHGTIRGAARALGRPKSTVADRLRRYGLAPERRFGL